MAKFGLFCSGKEDSENGKMTHLYRENKNLAPKLAAFSGGQIACFSIAQLTHDTKNLPNAVDVEVFPALTHDVVDEIKFWNSLEKFLEEAE